jgi:hypothetical protein
MLNQTVTTFKSLRSTSPHENLPLLAILEDIKSGKWKNRVEPCARDLSKKNFLPVFTPTGIFNHRSIAGIEQYNGIVCLDIDHVENPSELKEKCKNIPWVAAAFLTPSGKGLKVSIQTNAVFENYQQIELQVAEVFEKETGFLRDNRCKDIARIQFVSYDPDLYINTSAIIF